MSKTAWPHGFIFSPCVAGQVAELLAADREQRTEHDDLALLLPLEHRLEAGAQRERRLAGAGATAERDDADLGVEQQVDRDPLLGGAAVQAEDLAVAAHEPVLAVAGDAAEGRAALGVDDEAGVDRQAAHRRRRWRSRVS